MALILNIETATKACSVALGRDGEILAVKEQVDAQYSHSEQLNMFIMEVLESANVAIKELEAVAISSGPGSYTGLRIGTSTAKGICYGLGIPLISVSTLKGMAFGQNEGLTGIVVPMIDARRMEVYTATYTNTLEELVPVSAKIIDENSFQDELQQGNVYFFGDGAEKCKPMLTQHPNAIFIDDIHPSATSMVALSEAAFVQQQFENVAYYEPFYLKDFIAIKPKKLV
jgi:tRNA threonylcarbamoyladenosine biosynthesis protein TsaB